MTNPVILLGTQSNGETLPVQVDATGRLVAEGLQGQQGPEGPEGPQGPVGPEGPEGGGIQLPPDPYEGALLGWLNGELAWVSNEPIPIPEGVFGPITDWDPESGYLTVEGDVPPYVGNGVYLWQCQSNGVHYTEGWDTSETWSSFGTVTGNLLGLEPDPVFDGDLESYTGGGWAAGQSGYGTFTFTVPRPVASTIRVYCAGMNRIKVNGREYQPGNDRVFNWLTITDEVSLRSFSSWGSNGGWSWIAAIEIDGVRLVDTDQSLSIRVNQLFGSGIIGVSSNPVDFTVGKYLRIPEQRVAPWVLYGNDPTSLIDHLRSS